MLSKPLNPYRNYSLEKEKYHIQVPNGSGRNLALIMTITGENETTISFMIRGKNRSITIQCNYPEVRKKGEKHYRFKWEIVEGTVNHDFFEHICARLVKVLQLREGEIPLYP